MGYKEHVQALVQTAELAKEHIGTLYIERPVLNRDDIAKWLAGYRVVDGLTDPQDYHVTVAYSTKHVDWSTIQPVMTRLVLPAKKRSIQVFGEAIVLLVESPAL